MSVGIQYLASWLRGVGCVAFYNLMEVEFLILPAYGRIHL